VGPIVTLQYLAQTLVLALFCRLGRPKASIIRSDWTQPAFYQIQNLITSFNIVYRLNEAYHDRGIVEVVADLRHNDVIW